MDMEKLTERARGFVQAAQTIAIREQNQQLETQHWIEVALACFYITHGTSKDLISMCSSIGRMLNSMINKAQLFCANEIELTYSRIPDIDYRLPATEH